MDPRQLFSDERLRGFCVYRGRAPESRDHCPSKVLLDEPFPPNLPVVEACLECNNNSSLDEQYVACLIEAVVCGSTNANNIFRLHIKRILEETPGLAARLENGKRVDKAGLASEKYQLTHGDTHSHLLREMIEIRASLLS
jgi:hypothetical protein